ncbi:hypothetical protein NQ317_002912 [Molorchus minor]|uniref:Sprouty n=1 Tax=Molorchus minor TaxID=1323400 RepID=A0ABQ9JLF7_9CUCU|nr:hypothetical protein NQ317_002912 [Molorchus minor]
MASHGGPASLPRAHCPRGPIMNISSLTVPLAPLRPASSVTLTVPRPENERAINEYVETPFRAVLPYCPPHPSRTERPTRLAIPAPPTSLTKQPTISTFNKEPIPECATRQSIMCAECGKCRCESCQQPRPLPQKWICNNSCLVSADSVIDYASCLCCVKGLFYHFSDPDGNANCADNPCGCETDQRTARWGCLTALSCVLPCLWLYWPLRSCKRVVEICYARHSRTGCRCRQSVPTPEKRLLDTSLDF